ncbi:nucleotidyltransferase domain-containing protein [Candidatus Pacearchaeota archaeon]|nr:nucleotidyltransferase domain-containing protein [Candidatus Pacearchaeota archaeon]
MVYSDKLKFTILQRNILDVLFVKVGSVLSQRDLSKIIGVSPTAIGKALPGLVKMKLVNIGIDKSGRSEIDLNFDNSLIVNMKRIFNFNSIYESGLYLFLEEKFPTATIVLFGSYSRGEDTLKSDIDIAIIGAKEKEINLDKYERVLEREIILQFYDSFSKIHKNLKENLFNGVVYSGGIEL